MKNYLGRNLFILLLFFALSALSIPKTNVNLLLSAGALSSAKLPFYDSPIFVGDPNPPFIISYIGNVYLTDDMVLYSSDPLNESEILKASEKRIAGSYAGICGESFYGFSFTNKPNEEVLNYLNAQGTNLTYEKRAINNKEIIAVAKSSDKKIKWPTSSEALRVMPAVIIDDQQGSSHLLIAESMGDFVNRMALIDKLKKDGDPLLVELGNDGTPDKTISVEMIAEFTKRNPAAIFLGTSELQAIMKPSDQIKALNPLYPFADQYYRHFTPQNQRPLHFYTVVGKESLWSSFEQLGKIVSLEKVEADILKKSKELVANRAINIVRVFSETEAEKAARSKNVDVVVLVTKDAFASLPGREIIEKSPLQTFKLAPLIRVSYKTLSQVSLSFDPHTRQIDRVEINRFLITGERAAPRDVSLEISTAGLRDLRDIYKSGDRIWRRDDFNKILGGITLKTTGADLAILENNPHTTPIKSAIPRFAAKELLSPKGNYSVITTSGKHIKNILKLLKEDRLAQKLVAYGIDEKNNRIGGRMIGDTEKFKVAVDETALFAIFSLCFPEEYSSRAVFIESIYELKSLNFLAGPKNIALTDTADDMRRAIKKLRVGTSFVEVIYDYLPLADDKIEQFIDNAFGKPHHVVTLDLTYIDLGITSNFGNDHYATLQKGRLLPMGRGAAPLATNLFINAKWALNYDTAHLITSFTGDIRYLHTDLNIEPIRDKTKLGLRFRLPWERNLFKDHAIVVSPVFHSVYETKLVPNFWSNPAGIKRKPRKIDSLLGLNFNFTKLFMNMDLGALMTTDFNAANVDNALTFGPCLVFSSKWPLFGPLELSSEIVTSYHFLLPNNSDLKKVAFSTEGKVYLRIMRFYDFSLSAMSDFLIASMHTNPKKFAVSSIFGLTISYGRFFRLFG